MLLSFPSIVAMRNPDGSMLITILAHCIPYLIVQVASPINNEREAVLLCSNS